MLSFSLKNLSFSFAGACVSSVVSATKNLQVAAGSRTCSEQSTALSEDVRRTRSQKHICGSKYGAHLLSRTALH